MPGSLQAQWQADVTRLEQQMMQELERLRERADCLPADVPAASGTSDELQQVYRELENLEIALVQERQRVAQLLEEKEALKAGHTRDIGELEEMLAQVMADKEQLAQENHRLTAEVLSLRTMKVRKLIKAQDGSDGDEDPPTPVSRRSRSSMHTLEEPDIELSIDGSVCDSSRSPEDLLNDLDRHLHSQNLFHVNGDGCRR